jgi:ApaG protein
MYTATTSDITVQVMPLFLEDESEPDEHRYIWAYNIKITNNGQSTVQLLNRYWHITDAMGNTEEVRGPGVVGKQPVLKPGESFEYTSGCPLSTPSGVMVGSYEMQGEDGLHFDIEVPAFSLDSPFDVQQIN